jgi:hypothetical protein
VPEFFHLTPYDVIYLTLLKTNTLGFYVRDFEKNY